MSEPNANAIKTPSRPATNVRTITSLAMLAAIAYVVMLLSKMLPQVSGFLQMDLKDTVICVGGFLFGPLAAAIISIVVPVLEMLFASDTGPIGFIMNALATCAFCCTASYLYKKMHTKKGAVLALICGVLAMTAGMVVFNYFITPYFITPDLADTAAVAANREFLKTLLVPVIVPFNLIKAGVNSVVTFLVYKTVSRHLVHGENWKKEPGVKRAQPEQ